MTKKIDTAAKRVAAATTKPVKPTAKPAAKRGGGQQVTAKKLKR